MDQIEIRPATADDAAAMARVHYYALETFQDIYIAFWGAQPRDILPKSTLRGLKDPSQKFLVAVDATSDEVVGFVRYHIEDEDKGEKKDVQEPNETEEQPAPAMESLFTPKEHLAELWKQFGERDDEMDACHDKTLQGRKHIYIRHLMVDPNHQRKGIGKKLLAPVMAESDAAGLPTFIVSSIAAHVLYTKMGFESLETFPIDNAYWANEIVKREQDLGITGNEGLVKKFEDLEEADTCMVRWPKE